MTLFLESSWSQLVRQTRALSRRLYCNGRDSHSGEIVNDAVGRAKNEDVDVAAATQVVGAGVGGAAAGRPRAGPRLQHGLMSRLQQ